MAPRRPTRRSPTGPHEPEAVAAVDRGEHMRREGLAEVARRVDERFGLRTRGFPMR
jgi:hypothetical protein